MQFIDVLSTLSFIHSWDQCTLRWWLMTRPPKVLGNPLSAMNRTSAVFLIWGSPHLFFLDICVPPGDEIKFKYSWRKMVSCCGGKAACCHVTNLHC